MNVQRQKGLMGALSAHTGGVNVLFCDAGVRMMGNATTPELWRALATRAGGEVASEC